MFTQKLLWLLRARYKQKFSLSIVQCISSNNFLGIFDRNFSFRLLHVYYITFLIIARSFLYDAGFGMISIDEECASILLSFSNESHDVILSVQETACIKLWSFYCVCMHICVCIPACIHTYVRRSPEMTYSQSVIYCSKYLSLCSVSCLSLETFSYA